MLQRLSDDDPRIRVIKLVRNFGSNVAILAGMTYARGDCIGFIAADLQDPPETLAEMIRKWQAGDKVVLAVRNDGKGTPGYQGFLPTFSIIYSRSWYIRVSLRREWGFS